MPVDVISAMVILRPPAQVAAFAREPDNAPRWYVNIKTVEWKTAPPLAVASQVAFVAQFLGRGEPGGFGRIAAPLMAGAMRRANRKDLAKLKSILEAA